MLKTKLFSSIFENFTCETYSKFNKIIVASFNSFNLKQIKDIWYDTCTNIDLGYYWCSVDTVFANRLARCAQKCPVLARILVQSDNGPLHSSCQRPSVKLTKTLEPNQTSIDIILNLHNNARSIVDPPASAMPKIRWG